MGGGEERAALLGGNAPGAPQWPRAAVLGTSKPRDGAAAPRGKSREAPGTGAWLSGADGG